VHNATTKQRHAALRRKLGIFLGGAPRWVRERRARLARLTDALVERAFPAGAARTAALVAAEDPRAGASTERVVSPFAAGLVEPPRDAAPPAAFAERLGASRDEAGPPTTRWVVLGAIVSVLAVLAFSVLRERGAATATATQAPTATATPTATQAPTATAIPTATAAATSTAVVRGDTLWHLAARHLGDARRWPALYEANRDAVRDPDLIYPGQELKLPSR
jgi:nucleoid-associated protein YgaU